MAMAPGLFVAEGFDGPQCRGPVGGIEAEEQADRKGDAERESHRVGGDDGGDADNADLADEQAGGDADDAAGDREEHSFDEELSEDVAAAGPHCFSDSGLGGSFRNGGETAGP